MILDKYIFKELIKSQLMVLLVLVAIFSGQSVVKLMSEAATGDLPPRLIVLFLLYSLPDILIFLFPLTLYVAIIIALGRICSDSEMVVMRSVGYSPKRIMTVALFLAVLSSLVVGYISNILVPYVANQRYELEQQMTAQPEFLPLDSGRFVTLGSYNIYVEHVDSHLNNDKDINNVYIIDLSYAQNLPLSITAAKDGHMFLDEDGVRWLELLDGKRYEFIDKTTRTAKFESFKAPVSGNVTEETRQQRDISRMNTQELLKSTDLREQVEAQWRLSPLLSTIVLCIVAVPLSMVNPRQGRFMRLMPAILIYVAYYMFLMSLRNLITTEAIPLYPGLYWVPVFFLFLVAIPLNLPKRHAKKLSLKKAKTVAAVEVAADTAAAEASDTADADADAAARAVPPQEQKASQGKED